MVLLKEHTLLLFYQFTLPWFHLSLLTDDMKLYISSTTVSVLYIFAFRNSFVHEYLLL